MSHMGPKTTVPRRAIDGELAQLAQSRAEWGSRFVAVALTDQGVESCCDGIFACSDDFGCFVEAASQIWFAACICATRRAGRTGRSTAIGAWFAAFELDGGSFSRRWRIWVSLTSGAASKHAGSRGV